MQAPATFEVSAAGLAPQDPSDTIRGQGTSSRYHLRLAGLSYEKQETEQSDGFRRLFVGSHLVGIHGKKQSPRPMTIALGNGHESGPSRVRWPWSHRAGSEPSARRSA